MATKLEKMKAVAEDLNEVLAMDPPIPVDVSTTTDMRGAILVEVADQIYESDKENLKKETWDYLINNLGIEPLSDPGSGDAVDPEDAIPEKKTKPKAQKKEQKAPPKERGKAERKESGKSVTALRRDMIRQLIEKGKFTRKEIAEQVYEKYSDGAKSTITTIITDSKNPKYSPFDRRAREDKDGILSFKKK